YRMAFKFAGESKKTTIEKIEWSVSRNGFLTPVAIVAPVELSGAKINRVTLHNYGLVKQLEIKKGDEIEIVRSGEVIPKFLSVIKSSHESLAIPSACPSCQEKVFAEDIRLICKNKNCPDQIKENILNFIQKIGIEEISSKRLEEMIKMGLVKNIADLYFLKEEDFLKLPKVKEKLSQKFFESIQASKKKDIITFLSALGLTGGAYNKCEKIVLAGYDTLDKIKNLTLDKLCAIDSFAEKSSKELLNSLEEKFDLLEVLQKVGFSFQERKIKNNPFKGKRLCITGELSVKRSEMQNLIRELGGIIATGVSSSTDYLLTNEEDSTSSKFKKAQELNIPVISEEIFYKMIKD
ncbi:MAG: hypothetical protein KBD63_06280, partial [Bacteriovoracaceae bacterium]|nr:hypothetical protein [Bacteriovoracaceae bacterium]